MKKFKARIVKAVVIIVILAIFIVLIALKNNKDVAEAITMSIRVRIVLKLVSVPPNHLWFI